jgi:uncharacterized protein
MSGVTNLIDLLQAMLPVLQKGEFVFCTVAGDYAEHAHLNPLASFKEQEGLTLILPIEEADIAELTYDSQFKQIILTVHSSLDAVGLTAAVATKLTEHGISANVVAAYYHDHIFVPSNKAAQALAALKEFSND